MNTDALRALLQQLYVGFTVRGDGDKEDFGIAVISYIRRLIHPIIV